MDSGWEKKLLNKGYKNITGVDEAGRGAWAGPVVAGAVLFADQKFRGDKMRNSVKDSKILNSVSRKIIYDYLTANFIWAVGVVGSEEIDQIGIGQANKLAMQRAVAKLKITPGCLLVDYFDDIGLKIDTRGVKQGDQSVWSIAAASIIAKVYRDQIMLAQHCKYRRWRFDLHKGYGTKLHLIRLKKHGITKIHRQSFKPIKELKS